MAPLFVLIEACYKVGLLHGLKAASEPKIRAKIREFQQARKASTKTH